MASPTDAGGPAAPQRRWQAACPNCGAPLAFQSPTSPVAICSYCRGTIARDGDTLTKIGESSELFRDHSALQVGVTGVYRELAFTLVGRLQFATGEGDAVDAAWTEWHALFDGDDGHGWLSEDNDQFVFSFDQPPDVPLPPAGAVVLGAPIAIGRAEWTVASKTEARILAAEGELPSPPDLRSRFVVADLRDARGRVGTLDYARPLSPAWSIGERVRLADLQLKGLRDAEQTAGTVAARSFQCPECGAPVTITRTDTQSITCSACRSLIDVGQGIGREVVTAQRQPEQGGPRRLELGVTGRLALAGLPVLPWQILGFTRKQSVGDDVFDWDEYLLFNQQEGFAFLIDSQDGWTAFRTLSGVPSRTGSLGADAVWDQVTYRHVESYGAHVLWVEGEYYWKVTLGHHLHVSDYEGTGFAVRKRLSCEREKDEEIWSAGETLTSAAVGSAFGVPLADVGPDLSSLNALLKSPMVVTILVLLLIFLFIVASCSDGGGGSPGYYGGITSSGGGGHK